ncbi:hypothetical protein A3J90_08100 [candidate division WOR-1 bacterium RIFOXYC2_FULL_37_10]|uniref:Uncharacterized protein n=1 Tax=candidate division WOR-1 bacterium RIFOXYB2_FULL_37_13 TaxID=1802579 RepID=A0A1F4SSU1_UNCSA|nr:MAG: hypothetical protein A2246_01970 [candidate division WOR-1 bacterium RIFOXYA2_FULL_37_7]OGC23502.1 MAG: hypothetical protein A2310_02750 [candidate division WOR-1 bacterium RIFOXYB2_FULL_37_13]OGC37350.1 MAG: hypothetical protein A3J90_08100 [candidate division WOR-1 bacterium RIFOXYC2_FULL_37_10]
MIEEIASMRIKEKYKKLNISNELVKCIFYKDKICKPYQIQFKICVKCHRCKAITMETAIPRLFDEIIKRAKDLMSVFCPRKDTDTAIPPSEEETS